MLSLQPTSLFFLRYPVAKYADQVVRNTEQISTSVLTLQHTSVTTLSISPSHENIGEELLIGAAVDEVDEGLRMSTTHPTSFVEQLQITFEYKTLNSNCGHVSTVVTNGVLCGEANC